MPQALQSFPSIRGFDQRDLLTGSQIFPLLPVIALLGHIRPQTPHATQRRGLISCGFPLSPVMAKTGQQRLHAVQPVHASPIL
jgi:hypothetical protein